MSMRRRGCVGDSPAKMNSINKKAKDISQPFIWTARHAHQLQPVAAQLKTTMSGPSVKRPVAPPAYRPQPLPRVLQTKSAIAQSPHTNQAARRPVAPVAHRPEAKKVVPSKAILPSRKPLITPPVYRPVQENIAQRKADSSLPKDHFAKPHLQSSIKESRRPTATLSSSARVVQCVPFKQVRVTENTHLRQSANGASLAGGRDFDQVNANEMVTVDLGDVWGSHWGRDSTAESAIHDWYKVIQYGGRNISSEDVYIRAATIAIEAAPAQQVLVFEAWCDHLDVGHLLMFDPLTNKNYDFKGGKALPENETRTTFLQSPPKKKHAPQHDQPQPTPPEPQQETPPHQPDSGPYRPMRSVTASGFTASAQPLTLHISKREDARKRQREDPRRDKKGFHSVLRVTIKVTKEEYDYVMLMTLIRRGGGHYNLLKEATVADPMATRCLSPLEDLARFRGIPLMPGSAEWVLRQFVARDFGNVVKVESEEVRR